MMFLSVCKAKRFEHVQSQKTILLILQKVKATLHAWYQGL